MVVPQKRIFGSHSWKYAKCIYCNSKIPKMSIQNYKRYTCEKCHCEQGIAKVKENYVILKV